MKEIDRFDVNSSGGNLLRSMELIYNIILVNYKEDDGDRKYMRKKTRYDLTKIEGFYLLKKFKRTGNFYCFYLLFSHFFK